MSRTGRPSDPRSKLKSEDPRQGDGREGLWSRARLEQMVRASSSASSAPSSAAGSRRKATKPLAEIGHMLLLHAGEGPARVTIKFVAWWDAKGWHSQI
jgi:hypothetical protein